MSRFLGSITSPRFRSRQYNADLGSMKSGLMLNSLLPITRSNDFLFTTISTPRYLKCSSGELSTNMVVSLFWHAALNVCSL